MSGYPEERQCSGRIKDRICMTTMHLHTTWTSCTKPASPRKSMERESFNSKEATLCKGLFLNTRDTCFSPAKYSTMVNFGSKFTFDVQLRRRIIPRRTFSWIGWVNLGKPSCTRMHKITNQIIQLIITCAQHTITQRPELWEPPWRQDRR